MDVVPRSYGMQTRDVMVEEININIGSVPRKRRLLVIGGDSCIVHWRALITNISIEL